MAKENINHSIWNLLQNPCDSVLKVAEELFTLDHQSSVQTRLYEWLVTKDISEIRKKTSEGFLFAVDGFLLNSETDDAEWLRFEQHRDSGKITSLSRDTATKIVKKAPNEFAISRWSVCMESFLSAGLQSLDEEIGAAGRFIWTVRYIPQIGTDDKAAVEEFTVDGVPQKLKLNQKMLGRRTPTKFDAQFDPYKGASFILRTDRGDLSRTIAARPKPQKWTRVMIPSITTPWIQPQGQPPSLHLFNLRLTVVGARTITETWDLPLTVSSGDAPVSFGPLIATVPSNPQSNSVNVIISIRSGGINNSQWTGLAEAAYSVESGRRQFALPYTVDLTVPPIKAGANGAINLIVEGV